VAPEVAKLFLKSSREVVLLILYQVQPMVRLHPRGSDAPCQVAATVGVTAGCPTGSWALAVPHSEHDQDRRWFTFSLLGCMN
jgi:hypothetical protein